MKQVIHRTFKRILQEHAIKSSTLKDALSFLTATIWKRWTERVQHTKPPRGRVTCSTSPMGFPLCIWKNLITVILRELSQPGVFFSPSSHQKESPIYTSRVTGFIRSISIQGRMQMPAHQESEQNYTVMTLTNRAVRQLKESDYSDMLLIK